MKIKSNTSLSLRKFLLSALVAAPLATLPAPLWALPQTSPASANVTSSSATTSFFPTPTVLSITDPTATRLVLRWVNFGSGTSPIAAGETVIWNLPSTSSAVLNTVSTGGTLIDGALQSNGSIFILNPNGIVLGNAATVTAAGLGLSTLTEPTGESFFVGSPLGGSLSYSGTNPTSDVSIGTATINVGTTGNVVVAGRNANVSGTINAGKLTVMSTANTTTGVTLGGAGALTLGVAGVPSITGIEPSVPGTGELVVTTNGGAVTFGPNIVSVLGGNATITTGGGAISQVLNVVGQPSFTGGAGYTSAPTIVISGGGPGAGATATTTLDTVATSPTFNRVNSVTVTNPGTGYTTATPLVFTLSASGSTTAAVVTAPVVGSLFSVGDGVSNSNLTLNTGTGTVNLTNLGGNGQRNNVTLTTGATTIMTNWGPPVFGTTAPTGRIAIGGTVTGNLTVVAGGSALESLSDTTVTGGTISLATLRDNQGITFKGPGDLTFSSLVTRPTTGSGVTLTSTTGAIILPAATIGGNISVTAQTSITQTGDIINTQIGADASVTRTATFRAAGTSGIVTLTSAGNDFTRLVIVDSPSGATVNDVNSVILAGGTNATGNVALVAPAGVTLGHDATGTVFVNGNLDITTLSGVSSVQITSGGTGFTSVPTAVLPGTATGTAVLGLDAITTPTTIGAGYVTAPSVTITGGGGTNAAASTTLIVNTINTVSGGTLTSVPAITFTAPPTGGTAPVLGPVTLNVPLATVLVPAATGGSLYAVAPTVSFAAPPAGVTPVATATINGAGQVVSYTITTAGTGYLTTPTPTFTAAVADPGVGATALAAPGTLAPLTLATNGLGYTTAPSVTITPPAGTTALPNITTAGGVNSVTITNPGTGFTFATAPVIVYAAPPAGGTIATTSTATGRVVSVTVPAAGAGALVATGGGAVTFTGGGGTGAAGVTLLGAGGGVSDLTNSVSVLGNLNITSPGAIVINGATSNSIGLAHRFGQVNINQAASNAGATVYESTTLNLGTVTAASLRAYGVAGLIQTGLLNISGVSAFGAGTGAAPGDINLTPPSGTNTLGGAISLLDDFALLTNGAANGTTIGSYLARNFTVVNGTNTTIGRLAGTAENGLTGNLTVTAVGGTNSITLGQTNVTGTGGVTLTAPGAISATNTASRISLVTVNGGGNIDFRTNSNVSVNATLTQTTAGATASFRSENGITIGNFNSDYTGTVRFNTVANNRAITDAVNGIRVFGPVQFVSIAGITIDNSGHSFGGVTLTTTDNNGSATFVESGGLRLVDVSLNGSGSLTATSTTGDVLQDTTSIGLGIRFGNGNSSATFSAPLGRVTLSDATNNNMAGRINVTAASDVVISQARRDVILGNVSTGGKLTVDKSASGLFLGVNVNLTAQGSGYTFAPTVTISPSNLGGVQALATATIDTVATSVTFGRVTAITITNPGTGYTTAPVITVTGGGGTGAAVTTTVNNSDISQFAGSRLNVYDTVTLRTNGTGGVTIGNTGNRMGGIVASSGTGAITLTEDTTMNLKSVLTSGNLIATSENNNIIDSTDAAVVFVGSGSSAAVANSIVVGGTATFTATKGSALLGLGTSNYNSVGFTTAGDARVTDSVLNTTLATSNIGGTLDVFNTVTGATLSQSGSVKAQGASTFTVLGGNIDLTLSSAVNEFGGLTIRAASARVTENTTMNLRAGSSVTGNTELTSTNGGFITSGTGASSFTGNLSISAANGSIIPGAGSLLVVGSFTLFSNVLINLSGLSLSGNLLGHAPIVQGAAATAAYTPPGP